MDTVQALKEQIKNVDGVQVEYEPLFLADKCCKQSTPGRLQIEIRKFKFAACGIRVQARKVVQRLWENPLIDLQVVPLYLDQCNQERGDSDSFVKENAARVSYLHARQNHLFRDHHMLSEVSSTNY